MKSITRIFQLLIVVILSIFVFAVQVKAQTTLFTENFETAAIGQTPPAGWGVNFFSGSNATFFQSVGTRPGCTPASGNRMVEFQSFTFSGGTENRLQMTAPVSTVGFSDVTVDFAWLTDPAYPGGPDRVLVQYSTNGTDWTTVSTVDRYAATQAWTTQTVSLGAGAGGQATLYIAFDFISGYGNNCHLDLVHIKANRILTIGSGNVSCNYPYTTYWRGGRTQLLYTAAQLTAAGATPGTITSLGFNVNSNSSQTMQSFNINMRNYSQATLPGWVTGLQNCYTGTYAVPGTGWQMITLQTPFYWDGTNIILEICFGDNGSYTSYSYVYGTSAPTGQVEPYWMDNLTGCSYIGPPYNGYPDLPNLRFILQPDFGTLTGTVTNCYNGSPLAGVSVTCGSSSTTTNADGSYTLGFVPVGTYTVSYTLTGYLPGSNSGTVISNGGTTTKNICLNPTPAYIAGIVTSAATGNPIIGAKITVGTASSYSTGPNGSYYVSIYPVGTFSASCNKAGFDGSTAGPYTFTQGNTITQNFALLENLNPPTNVTATLNAGVTAVNLTWNIPSGNYESLYDDGTQEGFQIWTFAGSYNAVKFTPVGYPCTVNGGKINIGTQTNYPVGSNPLVPFQFLVYDASGGGGAPGVQIAGPFDYTPTAYGWNSFTFSIPVTIASGSFYIVQKQGGDNPNAAGIAIDATSNQLRSYMQNVPSPIWITASGNFLMRAMIYGPGGPAPLMMLKPEGDPETVPDPEGNTDNTSVVTGYQVWRLLQGQEGTQAAWTAIGTPTATSLVDNAWPALPCDPFRWAVKAQFTGNRWSNAAFSNVIGKCWTSSVTVNAGLSCPGASPIYTKVRLQNTVYVDTAYEAILDISGTCTFPTVWKGSYSLTVSKFGYTTNTQSLSIMGPMTVNVTLLETKTPPSNLLVNNHSLVATWNQPNQDVPLFTENWSSGSLVTNGWTTSGGTNWQIAATTGNLLPSVAFNYTPVVTNYNQYLTSTTITGQHSPFMTLKYDYALVNWATLNTNHLSVEIWNGTSWDVLKSYSNTGTILWTSESIDISAYTHNTFQLRFHAYGSNSDDINNWFLDNISVIASGNRPDPCLQGYSFYINSGLVAIVSDTTYTIPPVIGAYGQTLLCCVSAQYGSGASSQVCTTITSHYLCPPTGLYATDNGSNAYLSWVKPVCTGGGLIGYRIFRSSGGVGGPWSIIKYVSGPNTLNTTDLALSPGEYWYRVTAYYDLSSYGFPGSFDESLPAGPEPVYINFIPDNRTIQNKTITSGMTECFDAIQVITVAGNNTFYTIQNGGAVTMIAGQKISFLPTTTVQPGGYLHGSITTTAAYCGAKAPSLVSISDPDLKKSSVENSSFFNVYPNPTTGIFTLELDESISSESVRVEIFDVMGEKIVVTHLAGDKKHTFSLANQPVGVYFVRVTAKGMSKSAKVIRQ